MGSPRLALSGKVLITVASAVLLAAVSSLPLTRVRAEAAAGEAPAAAPGQTPAAPAAAPETIVLKHDDESKDGERSLGASGHFVRFQCPQGKWWLTEVQIHGARYGTPEPPSDQFTITLCDNEFKTLKYIKKPYSIFSERGAWRDCSVPVPPLELPALRIGGKESEPVSFWINVAFNPSSTKGVYVGYDNSNPECFSRTGLPDHTPAEIPDRYNWMIRAVITNSPPQQAPARLGEWLEPRKPLVPWQEAGLIELKNDDGESDGKQSMGGAGPAVRFQNAPEGAKLVRLRLYGSRYGSGYDPEATYVDYYVYDDGLRLLQTGRIPYARSSYQERWVDVQLQPVPVPGAFWVLINPNAHQYKGIYFYYDKDVTAAHSKCGRIPEETSDLKEPWDWMIRAYVEVPKPAAQ